MVHDSANDGVIVVVPGSNATRRLKIRFAEASKVVPVVDNCGLKPSGLASEQYTNVFFCLG